MSGIGHVEQKGSSVYAYSVAGGSLLWAKNGRLVAFNGTTVVVEYCCRIHVYDEYGNDVS